MSVKTLYWENGILKLIDQTKLPQEMVYIDCKTKEEVWDAIKVLKVRGAPAIGIAGAYGVVLGIKDSKEIQFDNFIKELEEITSYLAVVRPTAVNLAWALNRMKKIAVNNKGKDIKTIKDLLLKEAKAIHSEDEVMCRAIGKAGASIINSGDTILTHCNAGGLATSGYGTALAVMFYVHEEEKDIHVYVDETRPLLQGSRLTSWELMNAGIDCTLICDNMAATLMQKGLISKIIVGADRVARNGDTANKIGTYNLACLAQIHNVPLYIAVPSSSCDMNINDGSEIPIEERQGHEVRTLKGVTIAPEGVKVYNPAFDVTPGAFITGFITEKGIINAPFGETLPKVIENSSEIR